MLIIVEMHHNGFYSVNFINGTFTQQCFSFEKENTDLQKWLKMLYNACQASSYKLNT